MSLQGPDKENNQPATLLTKSSIANEGAPILLCQSNQTPLWIGFGCVEVGASTTRDFTLVNPQAFPIEVTAISSLEKLGILVTLGSGKTISLQPGGSVLGHISWSPQKNCSLRETVELSINMNSVVAISIHGFAGIGATYDHKTSHGKVLKPQETLPKKNLNRAPEKVRAKRPQLTEPEITNTKIGDATENLRHWLSDKLSQSDSTITRQQKRTEKILEIEALMDTPEIGRVLSNIGNAIRSNRIALREDQNIRVNVGLREDFLNLMLSYEPSRLLPVLEVVTRSSHPDPQERLDARRLMLNKILQSSEIQQLHCKPGVILTQAAETKYQKALDIHLLEKVFLVIVLLDRLRIEMLCGEDLRLFLRNSTVKSTKDVLVSFCKRFLRSEKNIIKHLSVLGFVPCYEQSDYDEFQFQASDFDQDLRDGIRLSYLVNKLSRKEGRGNIVDPTLLRIPAISRLQKLHNVSLLLQSLLSRNVALPFDEKSIVDGSRECVVFLLSLIRFEFESQFIISEDLILKEIIKIGEHDATEFLSNLSGTTSDILLSRYRYLLLSWVQIITTQSNYEVKDLASGLSNGLGLCLLLKYYCPHLVPMESVGPLTEPDSKSKSMERRRFATILQACHALNFPSVVPSSDSIHCWSETLIVFFLGFLLSSILRTTFPSESRPVVNQCLQIQEAPNTFPVCKERVNFPICSIFVDQKNPKVIGMKSASIDCGVESTPLGRPPASAPLSKAKSEVDSDYLMLRALMQAESQSRSSAEKRVAELELSHTESLRIAHERGKLLEERLQEEMSEKQRMRQQYETEFSDEIIRCAEMVLWKEFQQFWLSKKVTSIQKYVRGMICRQTRRRQETSAIRLQSLLRAWAIRRKVSLFISAVKSLQSSFLLRKSRFRRSVIENSSARKIQCSFRRFFFASAWRIFARRLKRVSRILRTWVKRRSFLKLRRSITMLQALARRFLVSRRNCAMSIAAFKIQQTFRGFTHRKALTFHVSASKIQVMWKDFLLRRAFVSSVLQAKKMESYLQFRAARKIVTLFRGILKRKKELAAVEAITRWYLSVLPIIRIRKFRRGICRLQALRRSLCVRRSMCSDSAAMYIRIKKANQNSLASPQLQLGNQTKEAITILLKGKMISQILRACQTLELSTLYSPVCCRKFIQSAASKILFSLICSCNRSTPHQELLRSALVVLLNVTADSQLTTELAHNGNTTELLVDLMQMFRDKSAIFNLSCELLTRLMKSQSQIKVECRSADMKKRLDGIFHILERKHRLDMRVKTINNSIQQTQSRKSPNTFERISIATPFSLMQQFMKVLTEE